MTQEPITIEGLEELTEILQKRAPKEFKQAAKRGMRSNVISITGHAKRNAPVDTGLLRSSIAYEVRTGFGTIEGAVGSNVEYAPYVETRGRPRGVGRIPWLHPAVFEHVKEIIAVFDAEFRRAIRALGLDR